MPLSIVNNDIRLINVDCIVCSTDNYLSGSFKTDKLVFEAAKDKLREKCLEIGKLDTGDAVLFEGFELLNTRNIIFNCLPIYIDGNYNEQQLFKSCYLKSLEIAKDKNFESVAIALERSNFPKGLAYSLAKEVITEFIKTNELDVYLLIDNKDEVVKNNGLIEKIRDLFVRKEEAKFSFGNKIHFKGELKEAKRLYDELNTLEMCSIQADYALPLTEMEFEPDESFSEALVRLIDEKGFKDPDVYHRANLDRKLFNHIINDANYKPRKETAIALCIGLLLTKEETNDLLEKAGYVLSNSSVFDKIIKYCLDNGVYDVYLINEILFDNDQKLLGR